jgi:hypothetical protein
MANTVESYGRAKHVDAYREAFGRLKDAIIDTSLPPPIETKYPDVWSNSLQHPDGTKLLIGTQVSNVLITSSMRLDSRVKPYVGSTNISFLLLSSNDPLKARIYLDSVCLEEALAILGAPATSCLLSSNMMYQLRQIRSKFSTPSLFFSYCFILKLLPFVFWYCIFFNFCFYSSINFFFYQTQQDKKRI